VFYSGLNGMRLGDIVDLVYTAKFSSDIDTGGTGALYLRVFLEGERTTLSSPRTHSPCRRWQRMCSTSGT
jgi:hypothetical protein